MVSNKAIERSISGIFEGILADQNAKLEEFGKTIPEDLITSLQVCFDSYDIEMFCHSSLHPLEDAGEALIHRFTRNKDAVFLIKNYDFLERHFNKMVKKIEGMPCSADKSRTIMKYLLCFFLTGKEIEWNYEQEYTYHLPKKIFTNHAQVMSFYEGLRGLYWGASERYLLAMAEIVEK